MGHLAIVNSLTIQQINDNDPYISIGGKLNKYPYKTISDLFADALLVRDGDFIFTWMIDSKSSAGQGFDRYFIANGDVVFDPSSTYPIKIGIKDGYKFNNALSEEQALDLFGAHLLWNAIGKKSLGRGRSLSHQTIDEDKYLLDLLKSVNKNTSQKIIFAPKYNRSYQKISINNFSHHNSNQVNLQNQPINTLQLNSTIWNKGDVFLYEKTLEAYLCENIDKGILGTDGQVKDLLTLLDYKGYHVVWVGNYLPYGVAGKNIDLVCEIAKKDNINDRRVLVIELKVNDSSLPHYTNIAKLQLPDYVDFIKKALESYRGLGVIVEPVVITHLPRQKTQIQHIRQTSLINSTKWIGYSITQANQVVFERLL